MERLRKGRVWIVVGLLGLAVATVQPGADRYGHRLQYALPLLGLGCSVLTGGWVEYTARFVALEGILHGTKKLTEDMAIGARPRGGGYGFPTGHTSAASFGASALVHECLTKSPPAQAVVVIAAGFTGATRIESGAHTIWQVLAGWILGWLVERLFRKNGIGAGIRRRWSRAP